MADGDRVLIHDLTVDCIIGDLPHERTTPQRVHLDLTLQVDCAPAAASDTLADAVDYVAACAIATRTCVEGQFHLVETLAEQVAQQLLEQLACIAVDIRVRKPSAVPAAGWVGCELRRGRT